MHWVMNCMENSKPCLSLLFHIKWDLTVYMLYLLQPNGFSLASKPSHLRGIFWNKTFLKLILSCWLLWVCSSCFSFWGFHRFLITIKKRLTPLEFKFTVVEWARSSPPTTSYFDSVSWLNSRGDFCLQQACQGLFQYPKRVYCRHPISTCVFSFFVYLQFFSNSAINFKGSSDI